MNALLMIYLFSAIPAALFMIYALGLSMSESWSELFGKVPAKIVIKVPVLTNVANNLKRAA